MLVSRAVASSASLRFLRLSLRLTAASSIAPTAPSAPAYKPRALQDRVVTVKDLGGGGNSKLLVFLGLARLRRAKHEPREGDGLVPRGVRVVTSVAVAIVAFYWFAERAGWTP